MPARDSRGAALRSQRWDFYCPADKAVHLDTEFFDGLKQRFGTPGHFAQTPVMAHDVAITFIT